MMGIYEIINLDDGKMTSYVGSSADVKRRWLAHANALRGGYHSNPHLQRAWNKYGEGAFAFCVLEQVDTQKDLLKREQYFLNRAFEVGGTYNIAKDAAAPMSGLHLSEEHKRKIGKALMGNQHLLGHKHSQEARRKMSEAEKGVPKTAEHRRKISTALMGHTAWNKGLQTGPLSEDHRRKIGEAGRGRAHTKETRRKMGRSHAGPYPAFIHRETGTIIPAGRDLKAMCARRGLDNSCMHKVKNGKRKSHKGWTLLKEE